MPGQHTAKIHLSRRLARPAILLFAAVLRLWSRLVELGKSSAEACFSIGLTWAKLDEPEKAAEWWGKVADEYSDRPLSAEVDDLSKR